MRSGFRFWVMFALLLFGGAVVNWWERTGEAHGKFTAEVEQILRADDYVIRDYAAPDGRTANFYVGYYLTQRNGATYHSPLNCLPGAGWTMRDPALVQITPAGGGTPFEA